MSPHPPLLEFLRGSPRSSSDVTLSEIVAQAERHGLATVVERQLAAAGIAVMPELARRLQRERLAVAAAGIRNKALLLRALDALAAVSVVPVALKGYAFALRYHPDPLLRPSSDVDLLVGRHDLPAVQRAMAAIGLTRSDDPQAGMEVHHHHVAFAGAAGLVEVHFRATSGMGTTRVGTGLALDSAPYVIDGRAVRILRPEDELVYLAVHAAQHLFLRLGWLYDLKLLIEKAPLDWSRVRTVARTARMVPAVYAALHALRVAFQPALPAGAEALRPALWQRLLVHRVFSEQRLVDATLGTNNYRLFLLRGALATGPAGIARHLWEGVGLKWRLRRARRERS